MREALTFDDVALVPRYNNVNSRGEPDLTTWLTKDIEVGLPLIPANMDTVIGPELARIVLKNGGIPIFHRFTDFETQKKWIEEFGGQLFLSYGVGDQFEVDKLLSLNPMGICLDVAHGHSTRMIELVEWIRKNYPQIQVIAGNVCTARAYHDLVNAGAHAIKVGIGPGSACTTRVITGFGVPQFTAIQDCAEEAQHFRIPIIADGGIRNSADVVKALAAGASTVMMGKVFALTDESAAEKRADHIKYITHLPDSIWAYEAKYRGQASVDFQSEFYGGLKGKTVAEGTSFWAPVTGPAQEVIDEFMGGIRSGLTYAGAKSIKELQRKAEFVKVTAAYRAESAPRRD